MKMGIPVGDQADVIVVGGGLAGLFAAALVSRAGRSVIVVEQAGRLGGRAAARVRGDIHWNLGPHALYRHGHAFRLLNELGISFTGRFPNPGRGLLVGHRGAYRIPAGLGLLLGSRLMTAREKWQLARFVITLGKLDTRPLIRVPLQDWLNRTAGAGNLSLLLAALFRVSTYCHEPERMSAGVAIHQLRLALRGNVWYLDGGWQTLVDGLRDHAATRGAVFRTRALAKSVTGRADGVSVRLITGEELRGRAAIVAVDPRRACELLDMPARARLPRWSANRVPVRAACLDLALSRLTRPHHRFALGLDSPLYLSVHSAAARLAPEDVAVVHVMKYLGNDATHSAPADLEELEGLLDQVQPGWKGCIVARRFLPALSVAYSLPAADEGGLAGRPPVVVSEFPGVFLAGDWVGPEGLLADASAASAAEAARCVLKALASNPAARRSAIHAND